MDLLSTIRSQTQYNQHFHHQGVALYSQIFLNYLEQAFLCCISMVIRIFLETEGIRVFQMERLVKETLL